MKKQKLLVCVLLSLFVLCSFGVKEVQAEPYKGVKLRIALISGFNYLHAILDCLNEAANELGAEVEASWYSFDEQHDKLVIDYAGGNPVWDIVLIHASARAEWVESGLVIPLGKWIDEHPELVDHEKLALDDYYDISMSENSYNGVWIGPPLMVTGVCTFYRTDLLNHPTEKENFKARYGYELLPPETYDQFRDIAEFFTRKKGEVLAGETLQSDFYGASHSNKPTGFLWYDFINYLIAFGADDIYDPTTMRPIFNSPQAIAAGKYYVSLVPFLPPGHMSMASGQSTAMFAEGSVAMINEFFVRGVEMAMDPEKSKVFDKIDFLPLPSASGVEERKNAAYHSGNAISIYSLSKNKEAAYKVLELAFTHRIMKKVFIKKYAPYGWVIPRPSVLADPEVQKVAPIMGQVGSRLMDPKDMYYFYSPTLPEYVNAMDITASTLSKALTMEVEDVENLFNDAQKELESLFTRAGLIK